MAAVLLRLSLVAVGLGQSRPDWAMPSSRARLAAGCSSFSSGSL